jgi:ATP-binding cassette, subfamily B, bacterial MsbA
VTLQVRVGEVVALVGPSGAGKTSLVHLILRFYEPVSGCITIDGTNIRHISLDSLRAQIGIVSQDVMLFDDTVYRNILYGNLQASEEQVLEAARAAYADDFVQRMPRGYETVIGERGVRLSGGEKQRLAIARALLRNPPILILDEATSSLDSASEQMVQGALENLMKHRTTFVIAHRLSTVRHADNIVVLHAGAIAEMGTHDELLARGGLYRRLYELQFRRQEKSLYGI